MAEQLRQQSHIGVFRGVSTAGPKGHLQEQMNPVRYTVGT